VATTGARRPLGAILRKRIFFVLIVAALLVFTVTLALEASEQETADSTPSGAVVRTPGSTLQASGRPPASPIPQPSPSGPLNLYAADAPGNFSPAVAGVPERVYVPNTLDGTVDVIDPTTYKVIDRIQVGGKPHHITPSWDLRHLYVDNPDADKLNVLDPRTARLGGIIKVASPYNLYFTPDGQKAIVVAEYDRLIEFRNPQTWRLLKRVSIPWPGVDHMDFSADGSYFLVSCEYSGVVVKVNVKRMAVVRTIQVGGRPIDVKISPDGKVFYVANQGLSGVSVIDPVRMRQIAFIRTGRGAHGFAVSRDTRSLYVANRLSGSISVISFRNRRVVNTWLVGGSPDMLQVSPDGKELWTSNRFGDTVSVFSTSTGRVIHTITVGRGPHGLSYFPQPGRFSLGHNGVYR